MLHFPSCLENLQQGTESQETWVAVLSLLMPSVYPVEHLNSGL